MVKKNGGSRCANRGEAKAGIDPNITLEYLLDVIIYEYMQTPLVAGGKVLLSPVMSPEGHETITLEPLCDFQPGCPKNFHQFLASAVAATGHNTFAAFSWWARSRLRYSCSTIVATFARFMVPYMKANGITEMYSSTVGFTIRLEDLEIFSLGFRPGKTHAIALKHPFLATRTEFVEAQLGLPLHCPHNVLRCRNSGVVIDCSLGQFMGTTKAYVFHNAASFLSSVPGDILFFQKTDTTSIDEQVARDNQAFRSRKCPDAIPAKFARRVFRSIREQKPYCFHCKGVASVGSSLKRCTRCKKAYYCCGECQRLHWKDHKNSCVGGRSDTTSQEP